MTTKEYANAETINVSTFDPGELVSCQVDSLTVEDASKIHEDVKKKLRGHSNDLKAIRKKQGTLLDRTADVSVKVAESMEQNIEIQRLVSNNKSLLFTIDNNIKDDHVDITYIRRVLSARLMVYIGFIMGASVINLICLIVIILALF